jgi:hypothetical protein
LLQAAHRGGNAALQRGQLAFHFSEADRGGGFGALSQRTVWLNYSDAEDGCADYTNYLVLHVRFFLQLLA